MAAYAVPTESRSGSHCLLALSGTSTAHHRKAESRGFLMYGTGTGTEDEKKRSSLLYGPPPGPGMTGAPGISRALDFPKFGESIPTY